MSWVLCGGPCARRRNAASGHERREECGPKFEVVGGRIGAEATLMVAVRWRGRKRESHRLSLVLSFSPSLSVICVPCGFDSREEEEDVVKRQKWNYQSFLGQARSFSLSPLVLFLKSRPLVWLIAIGFGSDSEESDSHLGKNGAPRFELRYYVLKQKQKDLFIF